MENKGNGKGPIEYDFQVPDPDKFAKRTETLKAREKTVLEAGTIKLLTQVEQNDIPGAHRTMERMLRIGSRLQQNRFSE
ncbi:hypothetical protein JXA63_03280 [Candidatus Woesebacteria bacterium]|nr:hypothetical protein [Candidatus Woesebacteria bacterium]